MRETPRPSRSHRVYRACRAEQWWKASSSAARPPLWKPPGRSVPAYRSGPGSPRSRECDDASNFLDRRSQITAPRDEDVRALVYKLLRRRKANAAIATGNERDLAFEFAHALLLCSEDVHAADDAGTPVLYLGAGKELPTCFARARRWASKRVHSSPSWRPGIVTSSPRSSPTRAASTMSSGDMTIDAGRFWYGSPAIAQSSVAVAPGSTAWMCRPLSASSCCSEWLSAMT